MGVAGLMALVHAQLTVPRRADQIVAGAAINLFALGITNLLNTPLYSAYEYRPRAPLFPVLAPEALRELPFIGPILFDQPVMVWGVFVLPSVAPLVIYWP